MPVGRPISATPLDSIRCSLSRRLADSAIPSGTHSRISLALDSTLWSINSPYSRLRGDRPPQTWQSHSARLLSRAQICLLYTSDAADDLLCVDLGGRRIIKKK